MLLNFESVSKSFGDRDILDHVTFYMSPGERVGVVGVNGSGKSTLLSLAAGSENPDFGKVSYDPGIIVKFLPQSPYFEPEYTILQQMRVYCGNEVEEYEIKEILSILGIIKVTQLMGTLSGGQRKKIALAGTLLGYSDFLILDEPTNHLDADMIEWLEKYLGSYSGALLMVTHDRYFLERIVTKTAELSFGNLYFYDGGYSAYLDGKTKREEMQAATERKRKSILRRELAWVLQGPCARGTKSRERLERYELLKAQLPPELQQNLSKITSVSSRLGKKTVELKNIHKSYNNLTVISDFSYILQRNDRIGIVGNNGAGKSTLLNIISGKVSPDAGCIETGDTVKIGYFTQHAEDLDRTITAIEYVKRFGDQIETSEGRLSASKLMEKFLFPGTLQHKKIGSLSGGELRRLYLLGILASCPNILLLDEPTNDLDIPTMQVLEDYLESFPGAIISVSHDRYFLDRICTKIFAIEDKGVIQLYPGGYTDWLEKKQEKNVEVNFTPQKKSDIRDNEKVERAKKLKFSYKEQKEFETIDQDITEIEEQLSENDRLQQQYSNDYIKLMELQRDQEKLNILLDSKMDRWVYLNDLYEKIQNQNG